MFIGIDPGKKGAVAVLGVDGQILYMRVMAKCAVENYNFINRAVGLDPGSMACIEKPFVMSMQGGAFTYLAGYGELRMSLRIARVPFTETPPQTWHRHLHGALKDVYSPPKGSKPKSNAMAWAKILWPRESFLATSRSRVPHDGLIDACLIAEYCRQKHFEQPVDKVG